MPANFPYKLYLVIGEDVCVGKDIVQVAEQAVKGGVDIVQLREKNKSDEDFIFIALRMSEMLAKYNIPLIINDSLLIAHACKAAGIHVGNSDIQPTSIRKDWPACSLLGYSIEYLAQLQTQETEASDYLGISPVFKTPTKTDTVTEWGLNGITTIRQLTPKPLVAIGNIHKNNAYNVIKAGADCLAVVSAICSADMPEKAAADIRNEIEKA
jgi:thiamine-phosphate pyrophosphorylase